MKLNNSINYFFTCNDLQIEEQCRTDRISANIADNIGIPGDLVLQVRKEVPPKLMILSDARENYKMYRARTSDIRNRRVNFEESKAKAVPIWSIIIVGMFTL